jgi:predicted RNase H-like HicB family nuclease
MFEKDIKVEAFWDEEAKVWVASSDDVPGLITEASSVELLIQKIRILIPELCIANNIATDEEMIDIPVHLLGRWQEVIKLQPQNG